MMWFKADLAERTWDAFVRAAIEKGDVQWVSECRAKVGGLEVWIGNYPYSYGYLYDGPKIIPSRKTRRALRYAVLVTRLEHKDPAS